MQKTHNADEATLDWEITSQDLVYVSNAKLKNWIKDNLFRDQLLEFNLSTSSLSLSLSTLSISHLSSSLSFFLSRPIHGVAGIGRERKKEREEERWDIERVERDSEKEEEVEIER